MYSLPPICLICLESISDLTVINTEILTELIYCIDKTEDFIPPVTNHAKMCKDCLCKLSTTFHFKKMCLKNIVRCKQYMDQLEQASDSSKVLKIEIRDVVNDCRTLNLKQQHSDNVFVKEEIPLHFSEDIEFQKQCADDELESLLQEETLSDDLLQDGPDELVKHESGRNEISDQVFICAKCDKHFSVKQQLIQHVRSHSKNKLFSCNKCLKIFKTNSALKSHASGHTDERLFFCSICNKSFKQKYNLNLHTLIHANVKLHSCSICTEQFTQKSHMNAHMVTHSKERPYWCSVCEKTFTRKKTLNQHMLLHTDKGPHTCALCKKCFTVKDNLKRHVLKHF